MKKLSTKTLFIAIAVTVLLCSSTAFACSCGDIPSTKSFRERISDHVTTASAVYTGKVIGFDYRQGIRNEFMESQRDPSGQPIRYETKVVKMGVDRWWKLPIPPVTFLLTATTRNSDGSISVSSCDYNFKVGETYLVFASGTVDALKTDQCSRTSPIARAKEIIEVLGEGTPPLVPEKAPR